jgi:hypothetical protein
LTGSNKQSKTRKTSDASTKSNNKPRPVKEGDTRSAGKNLSRVVDNLNKIKADTNLQLQQNHKGLQQPKTLNNKRKNVDTSQNG